MTRVRRAARILAAVAALAAACSSAPVARVLPPEEEYRLGMEALERGDYGRAAEHLNRLVLNHPESERSVEARYLLGQANFQLEEYPSAAQDFERFQQEFPAHPLADAALYWAGRSYEAQALRPQLDQADTQRAISSYDDLVRQYPASDHAEDARGRRAALRDRLAEKEFLNAQFYADQEFWRATEIYARALIAEYPESRFVASAYALLLRAYEELGRPEDARRVRETLIEQFPDSPEAGRVRQSLTSSAPAEEGAPGAGPN